MNTQLLLFINGLAGKNGFLDSFMIFTATYLVVIVFLMAVVYIGLLIYERMWRPVLYFFGTLVVSFLLLQLASMLALDRRPFMDHALTQLVAHAPGNSFPSDHTTVTAAIAMGLLLFTRFKKIGYVTLALAVLIGFSRIFVGIHYPLDIAGGLLVGVAGGSIVWLAKNKLDRHPNTVLGRGEEQV